MQSEQPWYIETSEVRRASRRTCSNYRSLTLEIDRRRHEREVARPCHLQLSQGGLY